MAESNNFIHLALLVSASSMITLHILFTMTIIQLIC